MLTRFTTLLTSSLFLTHFTNAAHARTIVLDGMIIEEPSHMLLSMLGMQILREDGLVAFFEFVLYVVKS